MFCFVGGVKAENLCLFQALCFASSIHRFDAWTSHLLDLLFILHGLETTMFTESRSYRKWALVDDLHWGTWKSGLGFLHQLQF